MAIIKSVSDWFKKKVAEPIQSLASKEASVWSGRIGDVIRGAEKTGQSIYNVGEKAGQGLYNLGQQMGGGVQFIKENLPSGLQSLRLTPTLAGFKDIGQKLTGGVEALKSLVTTGNILGTSPPTITPPSIPTSTIIPPSLPSPTITPPIVTPQKSQEELDLITKIAETQNKITQYQNLIQQAEAAGYGPQEDVIDLATGTVKPRDVLSSLEARTGGTTGTDYRTQMMNMLTDLQKQQQDYISTLQNMPTASQTYQTLREQIGLPAAEQRLTGFQTQIQSTENLLATLEKDINTRASGMGVSQPILNRQLAMEQRPLQEQLSALSRAAGVEQVGVTSLRDQLSQMLQLSQTEQERQTKIAGLPMEYTQAMIPLISSIAQYRSPEEEIMATITKEQVLKELGLGNYASTKYAKVSPGETIIDPSTGKVIYQAPEGALGTMDLLKIQKETLEIQALQKDLESGLLSDQELAALDRSPQGKKVITLGDLKTKATRYLGLIGQYGYELKGTGKTLLEAAYSELKISWKEASNLGALMGPDILILMDAIKPVTGVTGLGSVMFGGGVSGIKSGVQQLITNIDTDGQKAWQQLMLRNPKYQQSEYAYSLLYPFTKETTTGGSAGGLGQFEEE